MAAKSEVQILKERAEKIYQEVCRMKEQMRKLQQQMEKFQVHHAQFLMKFRDFEKQMKKENPT